MKAHEDFLPWDELQSQLNALQACMLKQDVHGIRRMLQELVPGYQPTGDVVDWVHLSKAHKALGGM
jgi:FlaA1/EpsC-like NDP-sugar epimerase